jgi:AraC-like DNA-binding protein
MLLHTPLEPSRRLPGELRPHPVRPAPASPAAPTLTLHPALELPLPLFQVAPPYQRAQRLRGISDEIGRLTPGSVLLLEVEAEPRDWYSLQELTRRLRSAAPLLPLALRFDTRRVDVLHAAVQVARMPVRAVLSRDEEMEKALRRQLSRPVDLASDVVEWLGLQGIRLSPTLKHLIEGIVSLAPGYPAVAPLLTRIGTSESSARFRLQKKRLPPPGRWLQAARALHAALHLQSRPDRPLLPLALALGYADHSALSHLLGRAFAVRPAEIRERLGWEWLLDRWLRSRTREGAVAGEAAGA